MGKSNAALMPFYKQHIKADGDVALLGFTDNNWWKGDLYDLSLNNWNINSKWKLKKKYDTIICTRCAYFSCNLHAFFERCHRHLKKNGKLFVDFGLGDHWRFRNYKVGWRNDIEHEFAYDDNNYLWSTIWDESFDDHSETRTFKKRIKKHDYNEDLHSIIDREVPIIYTLDELSQMFDFTYDIKCLWIDNPQLYILLNCIKK